MPHGLQGANNLTLNVSPWGNSRRTEAGVTGTCRHSHSLQLGRRWQHSHHDCGIKCYYVPCFGCGTRLLLVPFTRESGPIGSRPVAVICRGGVPAIIALLIRIMRMISCSVLRLGRGGFGGEDLVIKGFKVQFFAPGLLERHPCQARRWCLLGRTLH